MPRAGIVIFQPWLLAGIRRSFGFLNQKRTEQSNTIQAVQIERGTLMSRRTIILLAASAFVGLVCVATISTDAVARRGVGGAGHVGVGHVGHVHHVHRHPVARGAAVGVAVGVGAAATGAYYAGPHCGYHPYPPC